MPEPLTYINGTCQIGQREACGQPAAYAIAVRSVMDTAWANEARDGGVVLLCAEHAEAPVDRWRQLHDHRAELAAARDRASQPETEESDHA